MLTLRSISGRPRPPKCNAIPSRRPHSTTRTSSQPHLPRPLGAGHDISALNGYLLRSRQKYPDIRSKLVKVTSSYFNRPDGELPKQCLPGWIKHSHFAGILQNDFDAGYWDTVGSWPLQQNAVAGRHVEYNAHGDMFLRDVTGLILEERLSDSLPPGCSTTFYNYINSHPLFRLILALRLQLYSRREFRLFPEDPRPYRKHMVTLQQWASHRIPVDSYDNYNIATQTLENMERYLSDMAKDDPDLEAATRRVAVALGARVFDMPVSLLDPAPEFSVRSIVTWDSDWLMDICGDVMFLILHRGIKQAEAEFKANGGVISTKHLEDSSSSSSTTDTPPDGAIPEPPDDVQSWAQTEIDPDPNINNPTPQETDKIKIPSYLRKRYQDIDIQNISRPVPFQDVTRGTYLSQNDGRHKNRFSDIHALQLDLPRSKTSSSLTPDYRHGGVWVEDNPDDNTDGPMEPRLLKLLAFLNENKHKKQQEEQEKEQPQPPTPKKEPPLFISKLQKPPQSQEPQITTDNKKPTRPLSDILPINFNQLQPARKRPDSKPPRDPFDLSTFPNLDSTLAALATEYSKLKNEFESKNRSKSKPKPKP
ncbi:hypothetical protein TWF718_007550 [Orbilia javanica]|uniref:Uncharacterized protein n=1 Tax=Orbilia javanica TaxID=47235 RepID=A0AAN8RDC2_9PEZI